MLKLSNVVLWPWTHVQDICSLSWRAVQQLNGCLTTIQSTVQNFYYQNLHTQWKPQSVLQWSGVEGCLCWPDYQQITITSVQSNNVLNWISIGARLWLRLVDRNCWIIWTLKWWYIAPTRDRQNIKRPGNRQYCAIMAVISSQNGDSQKPANFNNECKTTFNESFTRGSLPFCPLLILQICHCFHG